MYAVSTHNYERYKLVGLALSIGIVLGTNGINVAHELGHFKRKHERILAKALLLPSYYMHFYIEHNFGRHGHAAPAEDPATERHNQSVYSFGLPLQSVNIGRLEGPTPIIKAG